MSLRDIRRFSLFYNFFVEYFIKNRNLAINLILDKENNPFYKNMTDYDIYKYSINLCIYVCYYLRLTKKEYREIFAKKMNQYFGDVFTKIPKREQEFIGNNIKIKDGISKNRALLENIFALFACLNAKVPLLILGKSDVVNL